MNALARFERFIADLLEGSVARALGARLEPVEIARQIDRAMDDHRLVGPGEPIGPNEFVVTLHPEDFASIKELQPVITAELATYVTNRTRERGWQLVGRPRIELVAASGSDVSRPREVRVTARVVPDVPPAKDLGQTQRFPTVAPPRPAQANPRRAPASDVQRAAPSASPVGNDRSAPEVRPRSSATDHAAPRQRNVARPRAIVGGSVRAPGTDAPDDDSLLRVELGDQPIRIGRAFDNDLVLDDTRVSRYHAEIVQRGGDFVLRDLGSKNGTHVNGRAVRECRLQVGDRIRLGAIDLRVE